MFSQGRKLMQALASRQRIPPPSPPVPVQPPQPPVPAAPRPVPIPPAEAVVAAVDDNNNNDNDGMVGDSESDDLDEIFGPSEREVLSSEFLREIKKKHRSSPVVNPSPVSSTQSTPATQQEMSPDVRTVFTSAVAVKRVSTRLFEDSPRQSRSNSIAVAYNNLIEQDNSTARSSSCQEDGSSNTPMHSFSNVGRPDETGTAVFTPLTNCVVPVALEDQFITSPGKTHITPQGNSASNNYQGVIKTFGLEGGSSTTLPTPSSHERLNEAAVSSVTATAEENQLGADYGNPSITPENNSVINNKQGEKVRKTLFQKSSDPYLERGPSLNGDMLFPSDEPGVDLFREEIIDTTPLHDQNIPLEDPPGSEEIVLSDQELHEKNPSAVPGQKRKRQSPVSEETPPKKRSVNIQRWRSSQAKLAYNSGIAHTTMKGKERKAREVQPACAPTCRKKCSIKISPEMRHSSFKKYYDLKDKSLQWHMLTKLIKSVPVKQRKVENEDRDEPFRKHTYEYYLSGEDGNLIQVCQPMFLKTFDISVTVVKTAMIKNSPDKRGKHAKPKRRLPPELINNVKEHIKQFPTVESHYCREVSRRQYLDENLSTAKMHRMYLMERGEQLPHTANLRQYRDIFNTCFNLSFFKPKKDQCAQCVQWERSSPEEKEKGNNQHQQHTENKKVARELKKADKLRSLDEKAKVETGRNIRVITMDLQKVLYSPKSEVGEFFYKRKLSSYNFTIFDCTTGQGYCFCWDQTIGLRGSDEVNSCLFMYFEEAVSKGVNEFIIYSDSCSGQNKNQFLYSMYYLASRKFNVNITHRYLEKGHTQMECDSVHAQIEKKTKKVDIFTPKQWYAYIRSAKVQKPAYILKEIDQKTILSFRDIAKFLAWYKVPTSKLREITFDCTSPDIKYKVNFGDASTTVKICANKKGRPVNWQTLKLNAAYSGPIPLEEKLVDNLKWYVKKGLIPENYLPFYNHLFTLPVSKEPVAKDVPIEVTQHREILDDDDPDNV